jgi:hypothetical protein
MKLGDWSFSGAWTLVLGTCLLASQQSRAQWFDQGPVFAITEENDAIADTDRHYSQGIKFSYLHTDNAVPDWLRGAAGFIPTIGFTEHAIRIGTEIGQSIFTPRDLSATAIVTDDRPYAGWLYTGFILQRRGLTSGQRPVLESFQLDIGVVGCESLAERAQDWAHLRSVRGWDNQLETEPGAAFKYLRAWLISPQREGPRTFDFIPHAGFSVGNIETSGRLGAELRVGVNLPDDFGAQTIHSLATTEGGWSPTRRAGRWGVYAFGGVEGWAVAYNEFLDGTVFRDSPHHVSSEPFVGEFKAGAALVSPHFEIGAAVVWRTEEFKRQNGMDTYGSLFVKLKL